jgi:hypothetical protein
MAKYIDTSEGNLYEDSEILFTNPGFTNEEVTVASITCGNDTIVLKHIYIYGSNEVHVYKNGTNVSNPIVGFGYSKVGFATRTVGGVATFYYVCADNEEDLASVIVENTGTGGGGSYPYNALGIGSYTWEDIAIDEDSWEESVDPGYDPGVSVGGINADTEPIYSEDIDDGFLSPIDPNAETVHDDNYFRCMQPYLLTTNQWNQFQDIFWYDPEGTTSFWHRLLENVFGNVTDPLSAIAGLIRLPLPSGAIKTAGSGQMYLGGVAVTQGQKQASAYYIGNRYTRISYGLRLKETFGTYFDYTHTAIELFLPYVNTVSLDVTEIMDSTLRITYIIDVYTGDLLCTLNCQKTVHGKSLNSIIGRWKGNCAMNEIFSRGNTQQHAQNLINGSMGVAGSILGGNFGGAVQGMFGLMKDQKVHTEKIGNCSGASGWMDIQVPYIIIKRDVPMYPEDWRKIEGAEQNATFTVNELSGYTEFEEIHVELTYVSDAEKKEIEGILKSGIIL